MSTIFVINYNDILSIMYYSIYTYNLYSYCLTDITTYRICHHYKYSYNIRNLPYNMYNYNYEQYEL